MSLIHSFIDSPKLDVTCPNLLMVKWDRAHVSGGMFLTYSAAFMLIDSISRRMDSNSSFPSHFAARHNRPLSVVLNFVFTFFSM